jgi:hypothetical protein
VIIPASPILFTTLTLDKNYIADAEHTEVGGTTLVDYVWKGYRFVTCGRGIDGSRKGAEALR